MPRSLLKKTCPYCNKSFLTYENEIIYCNKDCEVKHKYNNHFGISVNRKQKNCLFCGEETSLKFCNEQCKSNFGKRNRIKNNKEVFVKDKPKGRQLPYDVLNKIAEKKRVMKDDYWLYTKNRERI